MLISKNWINDFVTLPEVSDRELAMRFTLATAEVEGVTTTWAHLKNIKMVEIVEINKHPQADKLNLVRFKTDDGIKEVVCGAPNVKVGLQVPYAPIGCVLPGGFKLEPKKIRGILSEGMLCSEKELGLGDGTAGLMELNSYKASIGDNLIDILNLDVDTIIDVDNKSLTHRPDLWGHHGLAREFAAAFNKPFSDPYDLSWYSKMEMKIPNDLPLLNPIIDENSSCTTYLGLSVDGVEVKPSPDWLVKRLEAVGLRAINNLVDIGNYVMLELGIPMHIFDRDKIKGNLNIKKLETAEKFTTLDEVERELKVGDTVICDEEKTLVIAGIMGGANSGVSENTKNIFIEVANWRAAEVRKTSSRLGLRTDSSQRYEKSLDNNLCRKTMLRAMDLIFQLLPQAKVVGDISSFTKESVSPLLIPTSAMKISKVLGKEISHEKVIGIFTSLGFQVDELTNGGMEVSVPSYRVTKDIECEADLIEEIGRMIGYDSINSVAPMMEVKPIRLSHAKKYERQVEDFLVTRGRSFQVMSYPLIGKRLLEKSEWTDTNEKLKLVNALSKEQDRMRSSLIPSVLEMISLNQKNFENFSFFELGRVYKEDQNNFSKEENHLALVCYSKKENRFLELVNRVEELLSFLKVKFQIVDSSANSDRFQNPIIPRDWSGVHPFEYLNVKIMGRFQGAINSIHPSLLKNFKIKGQVSVAIINISSFDQLEIKNKLKFKPINKLPKSTFDCSVLVKKDEPAAKALEALNKLKIKQFVEKKIVGVFPLNEEFNSVTIRAFFEDEKETMTTELLKNAEDLIVETLKKAGYPLKM